jgi:hypothetical protein
MDSPGDSSAGGAGVSKLEELSFPELGTRSTGLSSLGHGGDSMPSYLVDPNSRRCLLRINMRSALLRYQVLLASL